MIVHSSIALSRNLPERYASSRHLVIVEACVGLVMLFLLEGLVSCFLDGNGSLLTIDSEDKFSRQTLESSNFPFPPKVLVESHPVNA